MNGKAKTESSRLRDVQLWLRWAVTEPRGVAKALSDPTPAEPLPRLIERVVDAPPLGREGRLDVYAEAYFSRLRDSLAADFETLRLVLGDDDFGRLIARYLAMHPSRSRVIGDVGERLPIFIASSWDEGGGKPYLVDLARLEWALIEAFYADDRPPFDSASLAAVPESAWAGAVVVLDPSVKILACDWPVDELWRARNGDWKGVLTRFDRKPVTLIVRRSRHDLHVARLDDGQRSLLEAILRGCRLGDAVDCVKNGDAEAVQDWFARWMGEGVIGNVEF